MTIPTYVNEMTGCFLATVDEALPGLLSGLFLRGSLGWGEFFSGSDVDFVGLWNELPVGADLELLSDAHAAVSSSFPAHDFDGFHCEASDLSRSPTLIDGRPVFFRGEFDVRGTLDLNLVSWHELAERPIVVRGPIPPIYTDLDELLAFTRANLDTFWRDLIKQVDEVGTAALGAHDASVAFVTLGPARLHHLLRSKTMTSKSGAGRYIIDQLDSRWRTIAEEALRIREQPESQSRYASAAERGQDASDLLRWLVDDGTTG